MSACVSSPAKSSVSVSEEGWAGAKPAHISSLQLSGLSIR